MIFGFDENKNRVEVPGFEEFSDYYDKDYIDTILRIMQGLKFDVTGQAFHNTVEIFSDILERLTVIITVLHENNMISDDFYYTSINDAIPACKSKNTDITAYASSLEEEMKFE